MDKLCNMRPIVAMGEIENIRVQEIKMKKLRDDKMNRLKEIENIERKKKEVDDLREFTKTTVPFDEMQHREKELRAQAR